MLLAEDNLVNQNVMTRMLGKLGCEVDVAGSGERAIQMHAEARYDLILMDCQMPGMDGFAATEAIRSSGSPRAAIPIIALTANALAEDREQCLAAGMDDFLAKPVKLEVLRATLTHWLAQDAAA